MTHSYPLMKDEFNDEPATGEEKAIKEYILQCEEDDYDNIGRTTLLCPPPWKPPVKNE